NDETGFKIERSSDGKTFTQISTVNVNVTTYADSGLAASTKYYYRILAYSDGGNSAYSNTAIATTTTPTPTPTPTPTNQPPVVDAGPDQVISLLSTTLDGSAIDDGLPNPPATLIYNWSVVTGPGTVSFADASAPNTTSTLSSAGKSTLRLTASDSALSGLADLAVLVGGPLPSPWIDQDIGAVGTQGRGSFLTGTFIERGSGADIGGSSDAFHYIYQPLNGDGKIIARIVTQYNSDPSAKAGVMIRETLTAGSKYAAVVITPS